MDLHYYNYCIRHYFRVQLFCFEGYTLGYFITQTGIGMKTT